MTKKMTSELFQHEVVGTSRTLGRNHDLRVSFEGSKACTNGSRVILPALPMGTELATREQMVMRGFVDHEAAHNRHTDFEAGAVFVQACEARRDKLAPALMQGIEDVRIERLTNDEYPGAKKNLAATSEAVDQLYLDKHKADPSFAADPRRVATIAITWEGRRRMGYGQGTACLDTLPADFRSAVSKWVDAIDACRSTQDVCDLAKVIADKLRDGSWRDDADEPKTKPEPGKSEKGKPEPGKPETGKGEPGKGEKGDGEDTKGEKGLPGKPESDGSDGDDGKPGDDEPGKTGSRPSGTAKRDGATDPVGPMDPDFEPLSPDMAEAVTEALRGTKVLDRLSDAYVPNTTAHDKVHTRHDEREKYGRQTLGRLMNRGDPDWMREFLRGQSGKTAAIKNKLAMALAAKLARDWNAGQEAGRLDTRRLVAAAGGATNVFKVRGDAPEIDTAVEMLIDLSGSMGGTKALLAQQVATILADCMERSGVKVEVTGFNNMTRSVDGSDLPHGGGYSRLEPLDFYVFKAFDEKLRDAARAMAKISDFAHGNNTDPDAIVQAWFRLRKRQERRKVMLVLSDGAPACSTERDSAHLYRHTKLAVERVERDGIACVGIGILDHNVERFYPRNAVVRSLDDLPKTTMQQLAQVLMGDRFRVDNGELGRAA
jgi:cobaltochelatase CobT